MYILVWIFFLIRVRIVGIGILMGVSERVVEMEYGRNGKWDGS